MVGGHGGRNARDGDAECREGELADGHPGSAAASQRGRLGGAGAGAPHWPRLLWARLQRSSPSLCDTSTFSLLAFAVTQWECACNECVGIYDALRDVMSNPGIRHNSKFACILHMEHAVQLLLQCFKAQEQTFGRAMSTSQ